MRPPLSRAALLSSALCVAAPFFTLAGEPTVSAPPAPGPKLALSESVETLGNVSGGYRRGAVVDGLLTLNFDANLGQWLKLPALNGTRFLVSALYPQGAGLSAKYAGDLNDTSNLDAYDSVRLYQIWLEEDFGSISLRAGMLTADSEFFVCQSGSLFFNNCFGTLPVISANLASPIYPVAAPGLRLESKLNAHLIVRSALYDGDTGSPDTNNKHGTRIAFHSDAGALWLSEAVFTGSGEKAGNYTLGTFVHTGRFEDTSGRSRRNDFGCYAIADAPLLLRPVAGSKSAGNAASSEPFLNAFARAGLATPQNRNACPWYLESGLVCKGPWQSRPNDLAGIALSYTRVTALAQNAFGQTPDLHEEIVTELSYQIALQEHLTFQPDAQYIIHPGATSKLDNTLVLGARLTLSF